MNKIKNIIGSACFLLSAQAMRWSMNWITEDKFRLGALDHMIRVGKIAYDAKAKWNSILTKN